MLKKSMYHEFRASMRINLILLGALLLVGLINIASVAAVQYSEMTADGKDLISFLLSMLYVLAAVTCGIGIGVVSILRFRQSFFSDEGYLTMCLPVNVHTQIWSRILVPLVWMASFAILAVALGAGIAGTGSWDSVMFSFASDMMDSIGFEQNAISLIVHYGIYAVVSCLNSLLLIYAAIALGHSLNGSKVGFSVLFSFIFYIGESLLSNVISFVAYFLTPDDSFNSVNAVIDASSFQTIAATALALVLCVVFYFVTYHCMTKKLNLA